MKSSRLVLVLVLVCLAYGCVNPGEEGSARIPVQNLNSTEGLVVNFVKGAPPDEIYHYDSDKNYEVVLEVENRGRHSIKCGDSQGTTSCGSVKVFSNGPVSVSSEKLTLSLSGKNLYAPGERSSYAASMSVNEVQEKVDVSIFALACYPYKTIFSESVCVDLSDQTLSDEQNPCQVRNLTFSGQGAPIAITRVEQQRISSGVIFKIFLRNLGKGNVIDVASHEQVCAKEAEEEPEEKRIGIIKLENAEFSSSELNCDNGNTDIALAGDSESFIYCVYDHGDGDQEAFASSLSLEFSYGYQSTFSKKIRVVSINDPPVISKFNVPPEANKETEITISGVATDDIDVTDIELYDEDYDGEKDLLKCGSCEGEKKLCEFSCPVTPSLSFRYKLNEERDKFEVLGTFEYIYRVRAKDSGGLSSKIKSSIVRVAHEPIISLLKTNGGDVIVVKAEDDRRVTRIDLKGWKDPEEEDEEDEEEGERSEKSEEELEKENARRKVDMPKECGASSCTRNFPVSSLGPGQYCIQAAQNVDGNYDNDNFSIPIKINICGDEEGTLKVEIQGEPTESEGKNSPKNLGDLPDRDKNCEDLMLMDSARPPSPVASCGDEGESNVPVEDDGEEHILY